MADIGGRAPEPEKNAKSEDWLAHSFATENEEFLRFVAAWGKWFEWSGRKWAQEDTLHSFDLVRSHIRAERSGSNKKPRVLAKEVNAVQTLVKADRRVAATVDQWDTDPWILNTPSGIVDLRTGDLEASDPTQHCSKITAAGPIETADCPMWKTFLEQIFGGDLETIAYMQRLAGYWMTGITREEQIAFAHGEGGNGKGVFYNTIQSLMGDYGYHASIETFMEQKHERHPEELASMRGARLVTAVETDVGKAWSIGRINELTGRDKIRARFMRQDSFEYQPQFKLFIVGNHKPRIKAVNDAIKRRIQLIPFAVKIENPDLELANKLKAEGPAILRWCLDGCLTWQHSGLQPPPAVLGATSDYLGAEDVFAQWLHEKLEKASNEILYSKEMYSNWKRFAEEAGEFVGSHKAFAAQMHSHGYVSKKNGRGSWYGGLKLKGETVHYRDDEIDTRFGE